MVSKGGVTTKCGGCCGMSHQLSECHSHFLFVSHTNCFFTCTFMSVGVNRGGGPLSGVPVSTGDALRVGSILAYVNRSFAPVRGA